MKQKTGMILGGLFTLLVMGLLVWGNFFASSETPQRFAWQSPPDLYICDTAPDWARPGQEHFDQAIEFWSDHGWHFANIVQGPCLQTCKFGEGERVCNAGKVTIDLIDTWFDEDHAGECTFPTARSEFGQADWATIHVPSVLLGSDEIDGPELPPDAEAVVLAHEFGHCLAGLEHNKGPSLGIARLNPKTGHVMNPVIYSGGWGDEAVPTPSW